MRRDHHAPDPADETSVAELLLINSRDDYRVLVAAGTLVRAFAVIAQLASDDSVDIVGLDLDL